MKLLYEAANTVEAHMILNLLEQSSLSARIDGEYLQGGVGELQAIGIVRVMVDEMPTPMQSYSFKNGMQSSQRMRSLNKKAASRLV